MHDPAVPTVLAAPATEWADPDPGSAPAPARRSGDVGSAGVGELPPARCADGNGTLSHLFFSDDEIEIARATAICGPCGRRIACLAGAIERREPYGVWGGTLLIDGVPVAGKPRRGRPPKRPAPPLVVDEVPVPPHLVA